ncbi:hypothetical protein GQ54DRAFT_341051 [Martensiomyces pterosporus]|nr:hypothetical protein GQ54DRAFT_341051 [Martensiomyces pterosporus]
MATNRQDHEEHYTNSLHGNTEQPYATKVLSLPANGKVSITHLVEEGLLTPGNVVVCNSWPYTSIVTASGTFDARWEPLPEDFVAPYGTEFMRPEFETPSAWATAVCRVMRAQTRAQKLHKQPVAGDPPLAGGANNSTQILHGSGDANEGLHSARRGARGKPAKGSSRSASSVGSGESRVAVNGWTACRVLFPKDDPNRALALRLEAEIENGALDANREAGGVIEIPLDALRRELCSRISRTRAAKRASESARHHQPRRGTHSHASSLASLVDGNSKPVFAEPNGGEDSDDDFEHRSAAAEKRTSAELSEISGAVDGLAKRVESDLALGCVKQRRAAAAAADAISATAHASSMTSYIQVAANMDDEDTSRRPVAQSLSRKQSHSAHSRKRKSIPDMSRHAKLSRVPTENSDADNGGFSLNADAAMAERMALSDQTRAKLAYFQAKAAELERPQNELKAMRGFAGNSGATLHLCTQCGSTGQLLRACRGCGDKYHDFCIGPPYTQQEGRHFLCPACRVCVRCLDDTPAEELLRCDKCGLYMHSQCSNQRTHHKDGLLGLVSENGRWICDSCVCCLECGFTMASAEDLKLAPQPATEDGGGLGSPAESKAVSEWKTRVSWAYDFGMCGMCAQQIERGKVCPECVATYSNCHVSTNMVCCDICTAWVHTDCDPNLTPEVYDALITLEDAPYVCPTCCASIGTAATIDRGDDDSDSAETDSAFVPGLPRCLKSRTIKSEFSPHMRMETWPIPSHTAGDTSFPQISALNISHSLPASVTLALDTTSLPVKHEPETEAANMLLSLTQSDVRFDRERLDVESLEARFCVTTLPRSADQENQEPVSLRDWRICTLCGLHGDGIPDKKPSLGRLIPLASSARASCAGSTSELATSRWAHVECLAWAWGPRPVTVSSAAAAANGSGGSVNSSTSGHNTPAPASLSSPMSNGGPTSNTLLVRFEGALLDNESKVDLACTLCGRAGASFHCCAPVACSDTAYHLPCLLFAGSPLSARHSADQPLYCAGWRRALCPDHVPMFSAMLPADGAIESASYSNVRVDARLDNLADIRAGDMGGEGSVVQMGGLMVLSWGTIPSKYVAKSEAMDCSDDDYNEVRTTITTTAFEPAAVTAEFPRWVIPPSGFSCIRHFELGGKQYSMHLETSVCLDRQGLDNPEAGHTCVWRGSVQTGAIRNIGFLDSTKEVEAPSLSGLVSSLLEQVLAQQGEQPSPLPPKESAARDAFVSAAANKPFMFLGLARCKLYDLFARRVPNYDLLCLRARMARSSQGDPLPTATAIPIPQNKLLIHPYFLHGHPAS